MSTCKFMPKPTAAGTGGNPLNLATSLSYYHVHIARLKPVALTSRMDNRFNRREIEKLPGL